LYKIYMNTMIIT